MEVNVLTLNCWGIPYISQEYSARLAEIGQHIAKAHPTPHIVGLQECFSRKAFERICHETREVLPYAKHYTAGPFGTGLAILSRWPIEETSMIKYPLNGYPTAFYHGDWYVGKGVACAKIRYGAGIGEVIDVLNTHMHAYYSSESEYLCHRASQAWEFGKILQAASQRHHGGALVIGLGDFNTGPNSLPARIIKYRAPNIHDTWAEGPVQTGLWSERGQRDDIAQSSEDIRNGATYGSPYNTWEWNRSQRTRYLTGQLDTPTRQLNLPPDLDGSHAIRIDYILANVSWPSQNTMFSKVAGSDSCLKMNEVTNHGIWAVKEAKMAIVDRHSMLGCSLSDHFGVEATLAFQQKQTIPTSDTPIISRQTINTVISMQNPADTLANLSPSLASLPVANSINDLLDEILVVIHDYKLAQKHQRWWRRARLVAATIVLAGSLAGVWAVGEAGWARFLLGISGALASTFAVLDGWVGLLFNLDEGAALQEFQWEVENARERNHNH